MVDRAVEDLATTRSSDFKKSGWRGVFERLRQEGVLAVTNHRRAEAVLLTTVEYQRLLRLAEAGEERQADALQQLRRDFDRRLAALERADAGDRLRAIMDSRATLGGRVDAGDAY